MLRLSFVVVGLLLSSCDNPHFQWTTDTCASWSDPQSVHRIDYCVKATDSLGENGKTLFAFHGMGGNGQGMCANLTNSIEPFQSLRTISHVVCPSFGPHWTIHTEGRFESFERFHEYIQRKYAASAIKKPVLYGESMGGFNVLKLSSAHASEELKFEKVAAACPAVFSSSGLAAIAGFADYFPRQLFGDFDPNTSATIVKDSPYFDRTKKFPDLFIAANIDDEVGVIQTLSGPATRGIYHGARDFSEELQGDTRPKGGKVRFESIAGGHCQRLPVDQMIEFLGAPINASASG